MLSDPYEGWLRRLSGKVGLRFGPASLELGVESAKPETLQRAVTGLENRLRRRGAVASLDRVARGEAAPLFEFEGASSRVIAQGAFLVAVQNERTAVLLAGSPGNAIGAHGEERTSLPISADPIGAVRRLFEEHGERVGAKELAGAGWETKIPQLSVREWGRQALEELVAALWQEVMEMGLGTAPPRTRGVASYAGMHRSHRPGLPDHLQRPIPGVGTLVLGSPIWVEQV